MDDEKIFAEFEKPFDEDIKRQINDCFARYIFYERVKMPTVFPSFEPPREKGYTGFCTGCRREFTARYEDINEPGSSTKKHGDVINCPLCKRPAKLHHVGRGKKSLCERQTIVVFRKLSDTHIIAQGFYAYKAYNGDPQVKELNKYFDGSEWRRDPEIFLSESTRYSFEPGRARFWKTRYDYFSRESYYYFEEHAPREPFTGGFYGSYGYFLVNRDVLRESFMRYCADDLYIKAPGSAQRVMKYYALYAQYPFCEMLLKSGLCSIVTEATDYDKLNKRLFDWSAKSPRDFLKRVSAAEFAEIVKVKPGVECLKRWQKYKGLGLTIRDITEIMRDYSKCDTLLDIMSTYKLTRVRAENYIKKQKRKNEVTGQVVGVWSDYLTLAGRLGYDLNDERVYMPKKLYKAHDTAVEIFNAAQIEEQRQSMEKRTKQLIKQFSFEFGGMMIVVPATMQDIINEGKALSHCVGGYAERHASGKTTILFLRRKSEPGKPFFTIEIGRGWSGKDPLHIVQCHGWKNEREGKKPAEVKAFEKEFGAFIRNPRKYKKEHIKEAV